MPGMPWLPEDDLHRVHAAAWKEMFDAYLRAWAARTGEPFDAGNDHDEYVDSRLRYDGVRAFLAPRGIELAEGSKTIRPRPRRCSGSTTARTSCRTLPEPLVPGLVPSGSDIQA